MTNSITLVMLGLYTGTTQSKPKDSHAQAKERKQFQHFMIMQNSTNCLHSFLSIKKIQNNSSQQHTIQKASSQQRTQKKFTILAPSPNFPRVCLKPYFVPDKTAPNVNNSNDIGHHGTISSPSKKGSNCLDSAFMD